MSPAATTEREPDPRIARSRRVILEAALQELGEVGYGAFRIESVAARARVGKSTIYRHWPDKLSLIASAFETLHEEETPELSGGSARERITRILRHVTEVAGDSPFSACMPAMIDAAERDARLRRFHHDFQAAARQPLVELLAEGVEGGEFPAYLDPQLAGSALLGAIFFRRLMTPAPLTPEEVGALVDSVLGPG
ncbi:MAG TPA: TetR/AcrR family transcriptional regulator [Chloroflexota bacterium]|nr:TetR/AcrR family transcriptional regulator [Chloroflexota bacterium]